MSLFNLTGSLPQFSGATTNSSGSRMNLAENRANVAKITIKTKLIAAIKDIQTLQSDDPNREIENCASANDFCSCLEAMLVHGTKHSGTGLLGKLNTTLIAGATSGTVAGPGRRPIVQNKKKLPQNNFWLYVMIFSHKNTLKEIDQLSQINTDIGKCRAWLRLALNEGSLASYLMAMTKDKTSTKAHYERSAFVRDSESLEIIAKYILGIEGYKFKLALNNSILNQWQTAPLIMAGMWISENFYKDEEIEIAEAVDVVCELDEAEEAASELSSALNSLNTIRPLVSHEGAFSRGLLNEDDALKLILKSSTPINSRPPSHMSYLSSGQNSNIGSPPITKTEKVPIVVNNMKKEISSENNVREEIKQENSDTSDKIKKNTTTNNSDEIFSTNDSRDPDMDDRSSINTNSSMMEEESIYKRFSSSPVDDDIEHEEIEKEKQHVPANVHENYMEKVIENYELLNIIESRKRVDENQTYLNKNNESRLSNQNESYHEYEGSVLPYLSGFIHSWNPFGSGKYFDTPPLVKDESVCNTSQFDLEIQADISISSLNVNESQKMFSLFDKITCEIGLDVQDYQCYGCAKAIGTIFGPAKLCSYTKMYYCEDCHFDETSLIPSKVVFNWDFRRLEVCRQAKLFLSSINIEPVINAQSFPSTMFDFAPELHKIITLRKKLSYVNAYLTTCVKSSVSQEFANLLHPREYIFSEVEKYSIRDLEDVKSGRLLSVLEKAFKFGQDHIYSCLLCSGKGFICEVCNDDKPVYPFNLETISQCQKCFTVFHLECSSKVTECPRCERRETRGLNLSDNNLGMSNENPSLCSSVSSE